MWLRLLDMVVADPGHLQVDSATAESPLSSNDDGAICDLISAVLRVLLLRAYTYMKRQRLARTSISRSAAQTITPTPRLLQPIIDILQYQTFCERVDTELDAVANVLRLSGVSAKLQFQTVGGSGEKLVSQLVDDTPKSIGGEAVLRIDERCVPHIPA